jgi:hypothetical protein
MKYTEILKNDDPSNSLNLLIKRINKGKAFDDEIAAFIGERLFIEEKYYKDLTRLTEKKISIDDNFMGGFGNVYKEYINVTIKLSEIHKSFAESLRQAENKMRARLTNQDLMKIRNTEIAFRKQLKTLNEKTIKIKKYEDKLKKKNNSHYEKKLNDALQSYQDLKNQYNIEVNPFFDDIEKSDEYRLTNMKDTFQLINNNEKEIYKCFNNINENFEARIQDLDIDYEINQYCQELSKIAQNKNSVPDNMSFHTNNSTNIEIKENSRDRTESVPNSIASKSSSFHKPNSPISSTFENTTTAPPPEVDEEGYSIPPVVTQPWAITKEPDEMNSDNSDEENDEFAQLENESTNRKLKIEIKNEIIKEENNDAETKEAITKIANRLPSLSQDNTPLSRSSIARRRRTIASSTSTDEDKFRYSYFGGIESPSLEWRKTSFAKVSDPTLLTRKSGMRLSVKEKMNTLIVKDVISKLAIFGDIYISFSTIPQELLQNQYYFKLKISNYELIKQAVPNPNYVTKQETDKDNEFTCNLTALLSFASQNLNTSVAILKYQINIDDEQKSKYLPLYVNPIWKSEPTNLSLLLAYQLNSSQSKLLIASEIRFFISLYGDIRGIQLKPHGIWNNDKKRLIWKDDNILKFTATSNPSVKGNSNENIQLDENNKELDSSNESLKSSEFTITRKLMAKFETGEQCPYGNINVQFNCNSLISTVEVLVESDNEIISNFINLENINCNTFIK